MTENKSEFRLLMDGQRENIVARTLPPEGPLNDQQREEVRAAVAEYLKTHKISQTQAAASVGGAINASTLNAILRNKYSHGTLDEHLRALNEWMEIDARDRENREDRKFVETTVARQIFNAAYHASESRSISLCHGPTGIGKTFCAYAVADKIPGSIYIRLSAGSAGLQAIRNRLVEILRLATKRRSRSDSARQTSLLTRLYDRLRGRRGVLIIDEAHRIKDTGLEFLRDLHDECELPILLLATVDLWDRIYGDTDADHGQFHSRLGMIRNLTDGLESNSGEPRPLFTLDHIKRIFDSELVKLDPDAKAYLKNIANHYGHGSLRKCRKLMDWAERVARTDGAVTRDGKVRIGGALLSKLESMALGDPKAREAMKNRSSKSVATG